MPSKFSEARTRHVLNDFFALNLLSRAAFPQLILSIGSVVVSTAVSYLKKDILYTERSDFNQGFSFFEFACSFSAGASSLQALRFLPQSLG